MMVLDPSGMQLQMVVFLYVKSKATRLYLVWSLTIYDEDNQQYDYYPHYRHYLLFFKSVFVTLSVAQQHSESWPEDLDAVVFTSIGWLVSKL